MAAQMHTGSNLIYVIVAPMNLRPCYFILIQCYPIKYLIGDKKNHQKSIMLYSIKNFWWVKSPTQHMVDTEELLRNASRMDWAFNQKCPFGKFLQFTIEPEAVHLVMWWKKRKQQQQHWVFLWCFTTRKQGSYIIVFTCGFICQSNNLEN